MPDPIFLKPKDSSGLTSLSCQRISLHFLPFAPPDLGKGHKEAFFSLQSGHPFFSLSRLRKQPGQVFFFLGVGNCRRHKREAGYENCCLIQKKILERGRSDQAAKKGGGDGDAHMRFAIYFSSFLQAKNLNEKGRRLGSQISDCSYFL